jgi:SSXT protein (N-terminal region)
MLDQNFEYIKLIADCQKKGRTAEATQYSSKLHQNLATMARVADTDLPADIAQVAHYLLLSHVHSFLTKSKLVFCSLCTHIPPL